MEHDFQYTLFGTEVPLSIDSADHVLQSQLDIFHFSTLYFLILVFDSLAVTFSIVVYKDGALWTTLTLQLRRRYRQ